MNNTFDDTNDWIKRIFSDDQRPEIQRGIRAIHHVLKTRRDAPNAMYRKEIGAIGFRYGWHKPAKGARPRSGHGLAHVIGSACEDYGKYEGSPKPDEVIRMIPEVIMDGKISESHRDRISIGHKGHLVLLSRHGKRPENPSWLFHAYKIWPKKIAPRTLCVPTTGSIISLKGSGVLLDDA